jgi:hypothetical protein
VLIVILVCSFSCSIFNSDDVSDSQKWNRLEMWLKVNGQYVSYHDVEFPRLVQSSSQADIYSSSENYFRAEYERVFDPGITQKAKCEAEIDFENNIINYFKGESWEYFGSELHSYKSFSGYDVSFDSSGVYKEGFEHYEFMLFKAVGHELCDSAHDISVATTIVNDGILKKFDCDETSELIIRLRRDIFD